MGGASAGGGTYQGESAPIRAPMSLWRCSRIMHLLRDLHPTLLSALEGIVDQVNNKYHIAGNFRGVLIFIIFMTDVAVTKFCDSR